MIMTIMCQAVRLWSASVWLTERKRVHMCAFNVQLPVHLLRNNAQCIHNQVNSGRPGTFVIVGLVNLGGTRLKKLEDRRLHAVSSVVDQSLKLFNANQMCKYQCRLFAAMFYPTLTTYIEFSLLRLLIYFSHVNCVVTYSSFPNVNQLPRWQEQKPNVIFSRI